MNFGTKVRTILAIATCLNTALMATDIAQFHNPSLDLAYRIISVVLNFIIVACATWFNNDYTETASEYTGAMRQAKAIEKGQDFYGVALGDEELTYIEDGEEDE